MARQVDHYFGVYMEHSVPTGAECWARPAPPHIFKLVSTYQEAPPANLHVDKGTSTYGDQTNTGCHHRKGTSHPEANEKPSPEQTKGRKRKTKKTPLHQRRPRVLELSDLAIKVLDPACQQMQDSDPEEPPLEDSPIRQSGKERLRQLAS